MTAAIILGTLTGPFALAVPKDSCETTFTDSGPIRSNVFPVAQLNLADQPGLGIHSGRYLFPNEHYSTLFAPALEGKKGTLISVGTFRAFLDADRGNFDNVLLVDFDRAASEFNHALLQLISESEDRSEFISKLMGRRPGQLLTQVRTGALSSKDFLDALAGLPRLSADQLSLPERAFITCLQNRRGPGGLYGDLGPVQFDKWILNNLPPLTPRSQQFIGSLFESDDAFLRAQLAVREGRYRVLTLDLSGKPFLDLAKNLEMNGLQVTAIDFSNAIEHISLNDNSHGAEQFVKNMNALPFSKDAKVLLTIDAKRDSSLADRASKKEDNWIYVAIDAKAFLKSIKRSRLTKNYDVWARDLADIALP